MNRLQLVGIIEDYASPVIVFKCTEDVACTVETLEYSSLLICAHLVWLISHDLLGIP